MQKEELIRELKGYRQCCARIEYLQKKLERTEKDHAILSDEGIAGAQIRGRSLSGMPTAQGGDPESLVERVVLQREGAFGRCMAEIRELAQEISRLQERRDLVDLLLDSLTPREKAVIRKHYIEGMKWKEILDLDEDFLTDSGLRTFAAKALEKMLSIVV